LKIKNKHAGDLLGKQMEGKTNTSKANNTFVRAKGLHNGLHDY